MIIEYIEKPDRGNNLPEKVYRVIGDEEEQRINVIQNNQLVYDQQIGNDTFDLLKSLLRSLNPTPFFLEDGLDPEVSGRKYKLVVENGSANFCFFWFGPPPKQWAGLVAVIEMLVQAATETQGRLKS